MGLNRCFARFVRDYGTFAAMYRWGPIEFNPGVWGYEVRQGTYTSDPKRTLEVLERTLARWHPPIAISPIIAAAHDGYREDVSRLRAIVSVLRNREN